MKCLKPEKQKAIEDKPDDKSSIQKEAYNKLFGKGLNEILKRSKTIDINNLIY